MKMWLPAAAPPLVSDRARNGLERDSLPAILESAAVHKHDSAIDRPPPCEGFAKPKRQAHGIVGRGTLPGSGSFVYSNLRELSFLNPEHDRAPAVALAPSAQDFAGFSAPESHKTVWERHGERLYAAAKARAGAATQAERLRLLSLRDHATRLMIRRDQVLAELRARLLAVVDESTQRMRACLAPPEPGPWAGVPEVDHDAARLAQEKLDVECRLRRRYRHQLKARRRAATGL